MIIWIAVIAAIAGFLFGFDEGIIAGALHSLRAQFGFSAGVEGLMTAAVPLGAIGGALIAGQIAEPYGRRIPLLIAAALFVAGAGLSALADSATVLTLARLFLGIAIGIAGMMAPLYIAESAPASQRGMLVALYQLAITLGILSAYLVGYGLDSWRLMFATGVIPAIALGVGMYLLSDTPRWLVSKGRKDEARRILGKLNEAPPTAPAVDEQIAAIAAGIEAEKQQGRWGDLLNATNRPALVVAMGLFFLQQLSGINAVIYYAPTVFGMAGFSSSATQTLATLGIGIVNVLATIVGIMLIDRIGRRRLLLIGFVGTAASLGMIAIGAATQSASLDMLAFAGLVLYIAAFAVSLGPLPWVMMAELFPRNVRAFGTSVASITNWGFNFLVVFSFPILVSQFGLAGIFSLYALICAAGIIFTLRLVPETKGVPLEAIESHLRAHRPLVELGNTPHTDASANPDHAGPIADEEAHALMAAVVAYSPYRSSLQPLLADITRIGLENHQINAALRRIAARAAFQETGKVRAADLGADRKTLLLFLEHIRFASPDFLNSVGLKTKETARV